MKRELYACVRAAEFPAQAMLRLRSDLKAEPVAVLDGRAPHQVICSINHHAQRRGAALGMTNLEGERVVGLHLLPRSPQSETAARNVVQECVRRFSPRIEDASLGTECTLVLDIEGSEKLFGQPARIAERLKTSLAEAGFRVSVVVSANYDVARIKAAHMRGVLVIDKGSEAKALGTLPISSLNLDSSQSDALAMWGIRTLGEFAELPEDDLVTRLGANASTWLNLARGVASHTFQPIQPAFSLQEYIDFETPVENMESLLFIGARMIDCLLLRANSRALCLASLSVRMRLDVGIEHQLTIRPALPSSDRKFLLKMLQLELAAHPPPASVTSLNIASVAGQSSKIQLGLFAPQGPEPSQLDVTVARLKAIVGDDRVGSPVLENTYRPGVFHVERFNATANISTQKPLPARTVLRRMRPPTPIRVVLNSEMPASFHYSINHYKIETACGPWRTSGCWWSIDKWDIDEWDILATTIDGRSITCLLVNYRSRNTWVLEALYD